MSSRIVATEAKRAIVFTLLAFGPELHGTSTKWDADSFCLYRRKTKGAIGCRKEPWTVSIAHVTPGDGASGRQPSVCL
jgi:hypothetical protein